jgi:hypothetical protein
VVLRNELNIQASVFSIHGCSPWIRNPEWFGGGKKLDLNFKLKIQI